MEAHLGRHDQLTSTRFADRLTSGICNSELLVFEECAHAPLYENVAEFNQKRRWRSCSGMLEQQLLRGPFLLITAGSV